MTVSRGDYLREGRPTGSLGDTRAAVMSLQGDGRAPTPDDDPTGSFSSAGRSELRATEAAIHGRSTETAQVLDASGRSVLVKTTGETNRVRFSPEETARMSGGVLTHNHPNSSGFSDADIMLTIDKGLREMRAVGPDGSLYRLGTTGRWTAGMYTNYLTLVDIVTAPNRAKIARGEMTIDQANAGWPDEAHRIMLQFAKDHAGEGVYYKRTRRK